VKVGEEEVLLQTPDDLELDWLDLPGDTPTPDEDMS